MPGGGTRVTRPAAIGWEPVPRNRRPVGTFRSIGGATPR